MPAPMMSLVNHEVAKIVTCIISFVQGSLVQKGQAPNISDTLNSMA